MEKRDNYISNRSREGFRVHYRVGRLLQGYSDKNYDKPSKHAQLAFRAVLLALNGEAGTFKEKRLFRATPKLTGEWHREPALYPGGRADFININNNVLTIVELKTRGKNGCYITAPYRHTEQLRRYMSAEYWQPGHNGKWHELRKYDKIKGALVVAAKDHAQIWPLPSRSDPQ